MTELGRDAAHGNQPEAGADGVPRHHREQVETSPVGMFVLDSEGRLCEVNPAFSRLFGVRPGALIGRALVDLFDPAERPGATAFVGSALAGESPEPAEVAWTDPAGAARICRLHLTALEDGDGAHGVVLDLTGIRRAARELRESKERFRLMVEGSEQVFFYIHDREGVFTYLSPSVEGVLGYRPAEMLGRSYEEFHPPGRLLQEVRDRTDAGLSGEAPEEPYEAALRSRDGRVIYLEITERPHVVEGEVVGMTGFARDITVRKQLSEELRQSQKMDAVGQLAGGVAHDFNNLLTTITGHVHLLLERVDAEDLRADLQDIRESAERAASLTRQLLAFSRKQVLRPRVVDINDVVSGLERLLRRLIGEDIRLTVLLGDGPLRVCADVGQLEQVLMNLAVNGRDAMTGGGTLTLRTGLVEVAGKRMVRLSVSDDGVGMDAATQVRIFEPFFTTKEQGRGTGLGLSTVYGIVKQSGGQIHLESAPGSGATFHVDLPESSGEEPLDGVAAVEETAEDPGAILVVDDDAGVRDFCVRLLDARGYSVEAASTPAEALEILSASPGATDLILTDLMMPGRSGRDLMKEARRLDPFLRALFMSGYTQEAVLRQGMLGSDDPYLEKPFTAARLLGAVRTALASPGQGGAPDARPS